MTSAAPSPDAEPLSGPVTVCVDRPLLSLDRPFTYDLPADLGATVGSVVQVPFRGRSIRGWVLGPADELPTRMLPIRRLAAAVPAFDPPMLEVLRWVADRYVAPLAAVIDRAVPPRVAGEEARAPRLPIGDQRLPPLAPDLLSAYRDAPGLADDLRHGSGTWVLRPAPEHEAALAVEVVAGVVRGGRRAIVLVPEADPLPATAAAVLAAFGPRAASLVGGDRRARYRTWLDIRAGAYDVVVGTRPAVFAPMPRLGLILVSREHHAQHREERAPYYHARDVAVARAQLSGAVCVLSSTFPSLEATAIAHRTCEPSVRAWPPVEVVRPGPEGRAPALVRALRVARRAFIYAPRPGYGVARVCRSCGEPALCGACRGVLRAAGGAVTCSVCGTAARCAGCGSTSFGIARGGAERVAEWASSVATVPVVQLADDDIPRPPGDHEVLVGGLSAVKDFGTVDVEVAAILDADAALRRPGMAARERALAAWSEVAALARPHGRVIVQTDAPSDPAIQSLVSGNPERFARSEVPRLREAGFPPGAAVFRVAGGAGVREAISAIAHHALLVTGDEHATVCLVALDPAHVPAFGRAMRDLAVQGIAVRVEADPHL